MIVKSAVKCGTKNKGKWLRGMKIFTSTRTADGRDAIIRLMLSGKDVTTRHMPVHTVRSTTIKNLVYIQVYDYGVILWLNRYLFIQGR